MTTQPVPTPPTQDAEADALPRSWQRLLALSGVVFAALFLVGWFTTGGLTPHYAAPNHDWTNWARDNQWNGRISGFLMLLAGFVFLHFMGAIRSVFGSAESPVRGSAQLARVAFGGALTGMAGIAMASVMLAAAGSNGADVDPVVSKAVATASGGPFLVAAMGFAAFLMAAGLLTLRTGVFARWTGIVALIGAVSFLITFLTVLDGTTDGSPFGYGFFPGILSLVTWTLATSIARYRAVAAMPAEAPA
jgi:succinate dehydrogenase/fumarate reductase cytochrome b subunit